MITLVTLFLLFGVQPEPDTLSVTGKTISVTTSRWKVDHTSTSSISSIPVETEWIQAGNGNQVTSILARVNGVFAYDRENNAVGERISIRGSGWQSAFGVRGITINLDELPLTTIDGQTMLELIDTQQLSSVQLFKGTNGFKFGNSSMGALRFNQPNPSTQTSVGVSYAGYGETNVFASSGVRLGNQPLGFSINGYDHTGFRNHSESRMIKSSLSYALPLNANNALRFQLNSVLAPKLQHPGTLTFDQWEEDPQAANPFFITQQAGKEIQHHAFALSWIRTKSKSESVLTSFLHRRTLDNPLTFAVIQLDRWYGGLIWDARYSTAFGELSWFSEAKFQEDERLNFENEEGDAGARLLDQVEEIVNFGAGVTWNGKLGKWNYSTGVRWDLNRYTMKDRFITDGNQGGERDFSVPAVQVGFSREFSTVRIFGSLRSAYDLPTTTELLNNPDLSAGFNPLIVEERHFGGELGLIFRYFQNHTFEVTGHSRSVSDLKIPVQFETSDRTFFKNGGEATIAGVEVSSNHRVGKYVTMNGGYQWLHSSVNSEDIQNENVQLPGLPSHQWKWISTFRFRDFVVQLDYLGQGELFADSENEERIDGFNRINVQINRPFSTRSSAKIIPFLVINNLTNEQYPGSVAINARANRFYEAAPFFHVKLGIRLENI